MIDPVELTRRLIQCASVTPADAGAMDVVEKTLLDLGFHCRRLRFGEIENLYARRGTTRPNLCFAGHTDVVPAGDPAQWSVDPFAAPIHDQILIGRGAVDMKGAIAAFISAVDALGDGPAGSGSISFLITGDEEGVATDGTCRVVNLLAEEGEMIDHCIVGEPTSSAKLGDMIKNGRRGSINTWITAEGKQGHVAYPDRAQNPIPALLAVLRSLTSHHLDGGYTDFPPSNLEVTTVDVDNPTTNMIPGKAVARLNIRFNPNHRGQDLADWIEAECQKVANAMGVSVTSESKISGEAFLTQAGDFTDLISTAVTSVSGRTPILSTSGGTSDARFIRALCPVIEFGLVGTTMHAVDEQVPVAEIQELQRIYSEILNRYFSAFA
jgi:succinyl-diaminopimelate desuccinylase